MGPGAPARRAGSRGGAGFGQLCRLLVLLGVGVAAAQAQGTVPTFRYSTGGNTYTIVGNNPTAKAVTTIPTVLVPVSLSFESRKAAGKPFTLNPATDVPKLLRSPVFSNYPFPHGDDTQYGDAMLRASFPQTGGWHTLLGQPQVIPIAITVPAADGYILTSGGNALGVVDLDFLQHQLFRRITGQPGKLVIAVTRNTTFYAPRPTLCCSWGTHGVDAATGNSFVLTTYLDHAPTIIQDQDLQPLTQQLAEFLIDPLHNPLIDGPSGNSVPAWKRPDHSSDDLSQCVTTVATARYLLEPTSTNPINDFPTSVPYATTAHGSTYHVDNVALLPWYTRQPNPAYSFPDGRALPAPAEQCSPSRPVLSTRPAARAFRGPHGHTLIGYWTTRSRGRSGRTLKDVSQQWDVVIVMGAMADRTAPEGTMRFRLPSGVKAAQFKNEVASLQAEGKKVLICLGAGHPVLDLTTQASLDNFESSAAHVVAEYGFNGIDIDLEIPTMVLQPGDNDFRHPTTPSIVHLIQALHALHDRFGPGFMISLVPEGPQVPAGYVSYGGGFGSYLPILYGTRDILSFVDIQNYNSPPLEGLDGNIYELGTVGYYASQNELLLDGFDVDGNPAMHFPGLPASKVAIGFITGSSVDTIRDSLRYLITGKRPAGVRYRLRKSSGYPALLGAMFWNIRQDRDHNYLYSNTVGPELHGVAHLAR